MTGWAVARRRGAPGELHAPGVPDPARRLVEVCEADTPALVLGSAQPLETVDLDACAAAGIAVVRRRSGGGAVLVEPGGLVWVDVVVPRGDRLWDDDVGRAFAWLGDTWVAALAGLGVEGRAHRGPMRTSRWSRAVCFAGVGPGEVLLPDGRKAVGISQRRTRAGARFQCAALLRWDAPRLASLLALDPPARAAAGRDLAAAAAALPVGGPALVDAFLDNLPD